MIALFRWLRTQKNLSKCVTADTRADRQTEWPLASHNVHHIVGQSQCVSKNVPPFYYFSSNSVRPRPILIRFGVQHPEETFFIRFELRPFHLKLVTNYRPTTLSNTQVLLQQFTTWQCFQMFTFWMAKHSPTRYIGKVVLDLLIFSFTGRVTDSHPKHRWCLHLSAGQSVHLLVSLCTSNKILNSLLPTRAAQLSGL